MRLRVDGPRCTDGMRAPNSSLRFLLSVVVVVLLIALCPSVGAQPAELELSEEEHAFLVAHPVVRIGIDPGFAPFEFLDAAGRYQGLGAEYVQRVGELLGIEFVVMPDLTWTEVVEMAFNREIDVLPCVGITEERKQYFDYSTPYLGFPRVIISRASEPYASLEEIADVRVAVQASSSHHGYIVDNTEISPALYDTFREALFAVAGGAADVTIGNLAVSDSAMRTLGLTDLAITGHVSAEVSPLAFAVRNDWPELASSITKALAAIPEEEKLAINQKWVPVREMVQPTPTSGLNTAWRIVGGSVAAMVVLVVLFWLLLRLVGKRLPAGLHTRSLLVGFVLMVSVLTGVIASAWLGLNSIRHRMSGDVSDSLQIVVETTHEVFRVKSCITTATSD